MSDMTGHAGESFVAYLKDRLPLIERALHEADAVAMSHEGAPTEDLDRYLYAPLAHFTAGGGKRVRPVLALLGAEAVGGCADQA
ncbi:MAG: polyprenyl synthetase family protein, partial [Collinsella sp.]|nr:polyprenyl synthetase family protein [Collinsella sp.]